MLSKLFLTLAVSVGLSLGFNLQQSSPIVSSLGSLVTLKEAGPKLNPLVGFFDPLNLVDADFWGQGQDATIGWLRHAEIKHGRVAMAAFVGYLVQSNGIHFPFPQHLSGETPAFAAGLSPPEQWDALPSAAKWQIIGVIGFLEWFSESQGTHYMRGGTPGAFPKFSESDVVPHFALNLYDPFGFGKGMSSATKEKRLVAEINNGRLAMIGIMGFLAADKVDGSVPALNGIAQHYDGDVMAPFSAHYHLFN